MTTPPNEQTLQLWKAAEPNLLLSVFCVVVRPLPELHTLRLL